MSTPERALGHGLQRTDPLSSVQAHPEWYFRGGSFVAIEAVALLTDEALSHGATDVSSSKVEACWVIESSHDWLGGDVASFFALIPDPERGPNTSRVEILLTAFCDAVWTSSFGLAYDVSGGSQPPVEIRDRLENPNLGRVIAFAPHPGDPQEPGQVSERPTPWPQLRLVDADLVSRYDEAISRLPSKERKIGADRGETS
jgi:hypothetical protein